jgi:homoserine O-acetyltransferase
MSLYRHNSRIELEMGGALESVDVEYKTYGKLNDDKSNVVWICHALTASADAADWWKGMIGTGCFLDPEKHFIVCANILGSCYGTTGPRSIHPKTGEPYGLEFPSFTMRDVVHLHELLAKHLQISDIFILLGGSCGGSQAIEMSLSPSLTIQNLLLVASGSRETEWNIAIHESQRMALEADETFTGNTDSSGDAGLKAARAIGILSYRTDIAFYETQTNTDERLDNFRASSYMRYQGQKLAERFHAHNYWKLTKCLDTHNIGRGRGGIVNALKHISANTIIIGISSDRLIPTREQRLISEHIPKCAYFEITSNYGHDGFLIETDKIAGIFSKNINLEPHDKRNYSTGT